MPLSPENQKLLAAHGYFNFKGDQRSLETLLNACRLEVEAAETCERCQGNGEVVTNWDRYKNPEPGDVGDEAVAECPDCNGQGVITPEGQRALLKAKVQLADVLSEMLERRTLTLEAALSRATQAEELVREVVEVLEQLASEEIPAVFGMSIYAAAANELPRRTKIAAACLAKLKAAPLQGDGAPEDQPPFRLYDRVMRRGQFGDATGSVMAQQRFDHGWEVWVHVAAYGSNHVIKADDLRFVAHKPTEGSGVLSLAPDTEIPSASGSEQQ